MAHPRIQKPFKPRRVVPGQPWPVDNRTDAQKAAQMRNFGIFQLRGLWALAGMLREPWRHLVRSLIDEDIRARGAEPQTIREARRYEEIDQFYRDMKENTHERTD